MSGAALIQKSENDHQSAGEDVVAPIKMQPKPLHEKPEPKNDTKPENSPQITTSTPRGSISCKSLLFNCPQNFKPVNGNRKISFTSRFTPHERRINLYGQTLHLEYERALSFTNAIIKNRLMA